MANTYQTAMVFDVFDTLVTSNIWELLKEHNPDLYARAQVNFSACKHEAIAADKAFRAQGLIKAHAIPGVHEALEYQRKQGHNITCFSNGARPDMKMLLSEGRLESLVDTVISTDDIGQTAQKNEAQTYVSLAALLAKLQLRPISYADDKAEFCAAARAAGIVPHVYHIADKGAAPDGVIQVAHIKDIPALSKDSL